MKTLNVSFTDKEFIALVKKRIKLNGEVGKLLNWQQFIVESAKRL